MTCTESVRVTVYRYRCTHGKRTFPHYPEGVMRWRRSERVVRLCGLLWGMGLAMRKVVALWELLGVEVGRMSVWRDVQRVG
ncbi:MAG: transposase, partial [Anaerolineales bacterium]|nr:transposase [Anaerolineales bacterium]